jgi:uncharacterized protein YbgA (DUF1722 family)
MGRPGGADQGLTPRARHPQSHQIRIHDMNDDPGLHEHLGDRASAHARVRHFFAGDWTAGELVRFHSAEKIAVLAHDPEVARALGRLVARQHELEAEELALRYRRLHAIAFARRWTPGRQANALMHLAGHLKDSLGSADRRALRDAIEGYRRGVVPMVVPLALLTGRLGEAGDDWARSQTYLQVGS